MVFGQKEEGEILGLPDPSICAMHVPRMMFSRHNGTSRVAFFIPLLVFHRVYDACMVSVKY